MASGIWKIFGTKGAESAQNQWIEPLAAAHNPEVGGSKPALERFLPQNQLVLEK